MEYQIRALQKADNRKNFESGDESLDHFFRRYAGQNQFRYHIGVTYVATDEENILGYLTVATGSLESEELPKGKKRPSNYPLPILRLGRLAVDQNYQGEGLGKELLRYTFLLALQQKDAVGCVGIIVDVKTESIAFYEKYGFVLLSAPIEGELRGNPPPQPMFLPIDSIVVPSTSL